MLTSRTHPWLWATLTAVALVAPARGEDPAAAPAAPPAAPAPGEQGAPPPAAGTPQGRVSVLEGRLMLRGKEEQEYSYAERNAVVRERDSLWTDEGSRAEIELERDSFVRLGSDTKLELRRLPPESDLRLWKGSVYVDLSKRLEQGLLVKTPAGDVDLDPDTVVRIDIGKADSARVSVYQGRATAFPTKGDRVRVAEGRRLFLDPGEAADFPRAIEKNEERDALDQFEVKREDYFADRPLPKQLKQPVVGARELQDYGRWLTLDGLDYWQPTVGPNWQPYRYGNWTYLNTSWTWNPLEPWGYATAHYGRWQYFPVCGWVWTPDYVWSPAWVYWGVGPNFVSWCPLNPFNQPCVTGGALFATAGLQIDLGCWNSIAIGDWGRRGRIRSLAEQRQDLRAGDFQVGTDPGIFPRLRSPGQAHRGASIIDGVRQTAAERVRQLESNLRPPGFVEESMADQSRRARLAPPGTAGSRAGAAAPGGPGRPDPFARERPAPAGGAATPDLAGSGRPGILPGDRGSRPSIIGGRRRDEPGAGSSGQPVGDAGGERGRGVRILPAPGQDPAGRRIGPPSSTSRAEREPGSGVTLPGDAGSVRPLPRVPRDGMTGGSGSERAPGGVTLPGRRPGTGTLLPDGAAPPSLRPDPGSRVRTLPIPDGTTDLPGSLRPGSRLTPGRIGVPETGSPLLPRGTRGAQPGLERGLPGDAGGSVLQPGLRPGRLPGLDDDRLRGLPGAFPGVRPSVPGIERPGLSGAGLGGSLRPGTGVVTPGLPGAGLGSPGIGGVRSPGVMPSGPGSGGGILPGGMPSLVPGGGLRGR